MNLQSFCKGIRLNPEASQFLFDFQRDEESYDRHKQQFYNDRMTFFETVKQSPKYRQLFLYYYVRFAVDAYEEYQSRGIADQIYWDTFSDIEIWCSDCKRNFGEYGIQEYDWLQEHVQLRLFRLGRLQFQPLTFDRELEVEGKKIYKNQIVLNVHIPSGEPLEPQQVEQSFELARGFFRGITPLFICHSWLIYPELDEILIQTSNIMQFQKNFFIYQVDHDVREAEKRIFNKVSSDPSEYEALTTLQRSAKAYLMAGNKLGSGYGIKL
ncbi:acyltransferase domain-containing protein [Paenibacillus sp. FA6]|uniref:acyltransferase domain-containing protein n=1 Tax=Paenibacillus sp. FA6 TaxID=3413029 RepID=UPI003F655735